MTTTMNIFKKAAAIVSTIAMMTAAFAPTFAMNTKASYEPTEADYAVLANEVAELVNKTRKELGLKPLYVVPYLNELAEDRAVESVDTFSHTRRDGSGFASIIDQKIVPYRYTYENLAAGSDNAEDTFEQWKNSPKHWAAIINPDTTHMGIGVAYDEDSEYGWYWQQLFVEVDMEFADQYLPTDKEIVPECTGDVNGDGVVDTFDYLLIGDYIYKKSTDYPVYFNEAQLEAADCFKDGIISKADAKVMTRYILGEYKQLPYVF